jgi:hypothetical protein
LEPFLLLLSLSIVVLSHSPTLPSPHSCICHGCPWGDLRLEGKNSYQHYADWYYGKTTGAASFHIDTRNPNGDGTLAGGAFKSCRPFPNQTSANYL